MVDEWVPEADRQEFYSGFRADFIDQERALWNNAPTWMVVSAIGTKLAYERYFGPEETKKAAETPPPISKDEV
jgi:hypothetical protein